MSTVVKIAQEKVRADLLFIMVSYVSTSRLNFTNKAIFLENSFIINFLDEAKLFWKKCFTK